MASSTSVPESLGVKPARSPVPPRRRRMGDLITYLLTFLSATSIVVLTCLIVVQLYQNSAAERHKQGWSFLTSTSWDPVTNAFGVLPFVYGTVVTATLALLIAVPIGVGAAIFLAELVRPSISNIFTFFIELLAAVPSVIYGLLGIFVLVPVLQQYVVPPLKATLGFLPIFTGAFYGVSLFSAGVVLSIMVVPFIVSVSREVLLAVPTDLREASLGLGATRWETTWQVVAPFASRGIMGSVFLALARALGETMAVTMVVGNTPKIQTSLLAPGYSIAAVIANEFTEATGDQYLSALIELGLVLFVLTILINAIARLMILATSRKAGSRG